MTRARLPSCWMRPTGFSCGWWRMALIHLDCVRTSSQRHWTVWPQCPEYMVVSVHGGKVATIFSPPFHPELQSVVTIATCKVVSGVSQVGWLCRCGLIRPPAGEVGQPVIRLTPYHDPHSMPVAPDGGPLAGHPGHPRSRRSAGMAHSNCGNQPTWDTLSRILPIACWPHSVAGLPTSGCSRHRSSAASGIQRRWPPISAAFGVRKPPPASRRRPLRRASGRGSPRRRSAPPRPGPRERPRT